MSQNIYTTICYFGTNIEKNGIISRVSKTNWRWFVNKHIVDKIKSFTISSNIGYWNSKKELTYTLTIIHPEDPQIMDKLIEIGKAYKQLYDQDEVIINTTKNYNFIGIN